MKAELRAHLQAIGPRPARDIANDAERAGWNAAVNIDDYSSWCVEGYRTNLNIYGVPYLTEADNDKELTDQISELYSHVVAVNGLRTVRFLRPSLKDILHKSEFAVGSRAHEVYVQKFYKQLSSTHFTKMDGSSTEALLRKLPPRIEVLTYLAPDGTRTGVSSGGFIGEGRDETPSRARLFGQAGARRIERPHKDYSHTRPMVERVSKQIVHLVTHQERFRFDTADARGYIPDWMFNEDGSPEDGLRVAWDGWENERWFDPNTTNETLRT